MNWWSQTALLWLPVASQPGPAGFPDRARRGEDDFCYYALDAFDAVARRRAQEFDREPWAYLPDHQQVLSPSEIDSLMDEWSEQMRVGANMAQVAADDGISI